MSLIRLLDLFDPSPSTFLYRETSISTPKIAPFLFPFSNDVLFFEEHRYDNLLWPSTLDLFDGALDLVQIERSLAVSPSFSLKNLADRVAALERGLERVEKAERRDRKYKWTAEINGERRDGVDRKYKWMVEAKAGGERNLKWTEEIKGKGKDKPVSRSYTFQASSVIACEENEKKKEKKGSKGRTTRVVEITDPQTDQGVVYLKKAFAKRSVGYSKGKKKELSPEDAALLIQLSFRAHLLRRAQVLRGLRELAVAKAKLKEVRSMFSNFSYRRRIASDAGERQRFTEKIIILLLTVEAIEGPDYIVRAAQRSMVRELEGMLEAIDPQLPGRLGSLKRRTFDLPDSAIQKEIALGVSEVVQLLNQEDDGTSIA